MKEFCPYYWSSELARAAVQERLNENPAEVLAADVKKEVETRLNSAMDKEQPFIKEIFAYVARAL